MFNQISKMNQDRLKYLDTFDIIRPIKNTLIDIIDPILMYFETSNKVLGIFITEYDEYDEVLEFITFDTSYKKIEEVLKKQANLYSLFESSNHMEQILINFEDEEFSKRNMKLIEAENNELLPKKTFYLDSKYPNKVDLDRALKKIELEKEIFELKQKLFELENSTRRISEENNKINLRNLTVKTAIKKSVKAEKYSYIDDMESIINTKFENKIKSEIKSKYFITR